MANLLTDKVIRASTEAIFSFLLLFGIVLAFRWMLADVNHYSAIAVMDRWNEDGAVGSLAEWEGVRDRLAFSQGLDSGEPDYHRLQALAYDWRGFAVAGEEVSAQELMSSRRATLAAYREMARRRPADPAGWAHVARLKVLAGERDDEFGRALRNALTLGANQPDVLAEVAYTVSLSWNTVSADETLQRLVVVTLAEGLTRRGNSEIFGYLDGTAVMDEVCLVVELDRTTQVVKDTCL